MGGISDTAEINGRRVEVSMAVIKGEFRTPRSKRLSSRVAFRESAPIVKDPKHMGHFQVLRTDRWFNTTAEARAHFNVMLSAMAQRYLTLYSIHNEDTPQTKGG